MGRSLGDWEEEKRRKNFEKNGWWWMLLIGLFIGFFVRGCS